MKEMYGVFERTIKYSEQGEKEVGQWYLVPGKAYDTKEEAILNCPYPKRGIMVQVEYRIDKLYL